MSEVQSKVVEIIVDKLGVKESEVTPEASFTNHLGADSLDLSLIHILWCHRESNQGHKDFQSFALPSELWHHHRLKLVWVSNRGAKIDIIS